MSRDDRSAEDVAGLFRKFGGDAHNYREFSAPEADAQAAGNWPLLSGGPIDRPPVAPPVPAAAPAIAPVAPVAPVATTAPAVSVAPFAPVAPLIPAATAATPSAPAPSAGAAPSELQALFARLAEPQRPAAAPGPMSRWRRPT
ncbi:hypothetical protein J2W28_002634 [Variovorax boronicumulans]|uniref:BcsR/BcsP family cellulose biosynthesis protein n=1 Tax=Variovorax boronicumulans TaxID=436515 RepID=UPI00277E9CE4|nr:BcsR/BcsP family cellulose biosynthesis protein [Variovorax boronicumulans]MDP9991149.1 hypothetical protein [Variovorax boronicumulans]MDQ0003487.1 hypothetical protein [Variovorax boronicumulans]MDQ0041510.1 hypothetical protein [Variovorax boronicumulans]